MTTTDYINILNAGSGLNTKEIIDALIVAERTPLPSIDKLVPTFTPPKVDELAVGSIAICGDA